MAQFTVNTHRHFPYLGFKFRVIWDNRTVAGISKVSALKRTTEPVEYREGGDMSSKRKHPGQTKHEAITLERGITHVKEFERWANKVWFQDAGDASQMSLRDFRKNITIEVLNEAGQVVLRYHVYRCWVSEFQSMGELDASGNAVLIETLKLENDGWKKEVVEETMEPSFDEPSP